MDGRPIVGISYVPFPGGVQTELIQRFGAEINGIEAGQELPLLSATFKRIPIRSLLLPSEADRAEKDLLTGTGKQRIAESYLYPYPRHDPQAADFFEGSVKGFQDALNRREDVPKPLPTLKNNLASLLYQHTVDSSIVKPRVIEGKNYLSFITEDPMLSALSSILFSRDTSGLSLWSGADRSVFIYSAADLPAETREFVGSIREAVAADLRSAKPILDRLSALGTIHSLEAVPVYPSAHSDHRYGYRISYSPKQNSGKESPSLLRMVSREELEILSMGGVPDGSGDRLQSKDLDFSQNFI